MSSSTVIRLGFVTVEIDRHRTVTTLPDGRVVTADHREQIGQADMARALGYPDAEAMNRHHDLTHSVLAHMLGLECSPTLYGVAFGQVYPHWRQEEAAVLQLQGFANAVGVDLLDVAKRMR